MIRRLRSWPVVTAAVAAAATAFVAWVMHQSHAVYGDMVAVQVRMVRLDTDFAAGDAADARRTVAEISSLLHDAQARVRGPSWGVAAVVPVAGWPARTVRGVVEAADLMADAVLPPLIDAADLVRKSAPSAVGKGVDLAGITPVRTRLDLAQRGLADVEAQLDGLPRITGSGQVDRALASLSGDTTLMSTVLSRAETAARLLPPMLGDGGVRRYFLAIQTNAEARGTGGLVGAYAIVTADHGRLRFERFGSDDDIPPSPGPVAVLGPQFDARYGVDGAARMLAESNLSPHFPYAARVWTGLWQRATGQRLDGAIATDPEGLGALLAVTGPVTLPDGESVTAQNAAVLTEQKAYARFPDPKQRKEFLVGLARGVAGALEGRRVEPVPLVRALAGMTSAGRLRLWSAHSAEQDLLAGTPLAGELSTAPGPFAQLVVNNAAGTKLDYYLNRKLDYTLGPCRGTRRSSTVRVTLRDTAPASGLPDYVVQRSDPGAAGWPSGTNRLWVSVYTALGARLGSASLDGRTVPVSSGIELGRPVFSVFLGTAPGIGHVLELALDEPVSAVAPVVPVQPLARAQTTRISAADCAD